MPIFNGVAPVGPCPSARPAHPQLRLLPEWEAWWHVQEARRELEAYLRDEPYASRAFDRSQFQEVLPGRYLPCSAVSPQYHVTADGAVFARPLALSGVLRRSPVDPRGRPPHSIGK